MVKLNLKLMAGAALAAALLAGCGGGDGGGQAPGPVARTVTDVVAFIENLISTNGENTTPIDTNLLTLATDDTAEPKPLK